MTPVTAVSIAAAKAAAAIERAAFTATTGVQVTDDGVLVTGKKKAGLAAPAR